MLYIVATPIGNLQDLSPRAAKILSTVDLITCEDTRQTQKLLQFLKCKVPMLALHAHNESQIAPQILQKLQAGQKIALVSDAGTPLINDPGQLLVQLAHQHAIPVCPIPGPSAITASLSASGLISTQGFVFFGFLPAKSQARQHMLKSLEYEQRTLIFLEAPHRLLESLQTMQAVFGDTRNIVLAREISKIYETIQKQPLGQMARWIAEHPEQQRGEIVLIVEGNHNSNLPTQLLPAVHEILNILQKVLPPAQVASVAAKLTGIKKQILYKLLENNK
jgi:16S rRNA (cytidine1402-2'-O)-methyltransferase